MSAEAQFDTVTPIKAKAQVVTLPKPAGRKLDGGKWLRAIVQNVVPPAIVVALVLLVWQLTFADPMSSLPSPLLVWEQALSDRLQGAPLAIEARMETQSILYRTIALFASTFVVVAILFVLIIWWVLRRGAKPAQV